MQLCSFNDIGQHLHSKDQRIPLSIKAELTYRCNFLCNHCYCRLPATNQTTQTKELTYTEWKRLLIQSIDEGTLFITFTGGEPLLRSDFKKLWILAKKLGLICTLFTNGSLITPEWITFFKEYTPNEIAITLYGDNNEIYKQVTGAIDMFDRVIKNINLLRDASINISTRTIFTQCNINSFDRMRELNLKYSDIFFWDAQLFGANSIGGGDPKSGRLTPSQLVELEQLDNVRKNELQHHFETYFGKSSTPKHAYRCSMGQQEFTINPYGKMLACQTLDYIAYDLKNGTVKDGWRTAIPQQLQNLHWQNSECKSCDLHSLCLVCPATAIREGEQYQGPTKHHCMIGKLRYQSLVKNRNK